MLYVELVVCRYIRRYVFDVVLGGSRNSGGFPADYRHQHKGADLFRRRLRPGSMAGTITGQGLSVSECVYICVCVGAFPRTLVLSHEFQ